MGRSIAITLLALLAVFILSFIFPFGNGENQTAFPMALLFLVIAVPAAILVGRFVPYGIGASSVAGALTGGLAVVAWVYGTFLAHEAGWSGLTIEDFATGEDTVQDKVLVLLYWIGLGGVFLGLCFGFVGYVWRIMGTSREL